MGRAVTAQIKHELDALTKAFDMTYNSLLPSARTSAIAAMLMFAPVAIMLIFLPRNWWADYPGILFHLAIFLLVTRLPAPEWAKAAGYGWLLLDVTVGVMSLNGVPLEIAFPIRLGGHIFAGIWIVNVSLLGSTPVKVTGLIAGIWLFAFTFVSPFFSAKALAPASILILVWLVIIAWQNGSKRTL